MERGRRRIHRTAEDHLRQEEWTLAFRQATLLLDLGNTFWDSAEYEELTKLIQTTRAEGNKLVKARNKAAEGGLDNLVMGIKLAQGIGQNSYLYQASNKAIAEFSKKIMEIAQKRLLSGDWQQAIAIANKIPDTANLKEQVEDFNQLANATSQALTGSVEGFSKAIEMCSKFEVGPPFVQTSSRFSWPLAARNG